MKLEVILGVLLVIALVGFFIYEFSASTKVQTTYYAPSSSSTGLFGLFRTNPLNSQNAAPTGTAPSGLRSPYAPYQGYSGGGPVGGSPYTPYASYGALSSSTAASNPAGFLAPLGFTASDASPYFGQVRFGGFGRGYNNMLTITLSASVPGNEKINITNWHIKANHGDQIIPQAVADYDPSGNNTDSDIVVGNGDQVTMYSTPSPVGHNFRLNRCIGYIDTNHSFSPPLPSDCPSPLTPEVQNFSSVCQDYISSLYGCQTANTGISLPWYDWSCRDYLATINYKGCYNRYRGWSGFFEPRWWVWTGSNFVDPRHDRVLLLDKQEKIVDVYAY